MHLQVGAPVGVSDVVCLFLGVPLQVWLWIINKRLDLSAPHCCHLGHGDVSSLFHTRLVLLRIKFEFEALRTSPSAWHTVRMT